MVTKKKKASKKRTAKKRTAKKKVASKTKMNVVSSLEREKLLIDNFVGLQKAMTVLASKFSDLSVRMDKFLDIMEKSARDYVERNTVGNDLRKKIDVVAIQNRKLLAEMNKAPGVAPSVPSSFAQAPSNNVQEVNAKEAPSPSGMTPSIAQGSPSKQPKTLPHA
jgi:hypothetical protein